jgi:hypothetical protein
MDRVVLLTLMDVRVLTGGEGAGWGSAMSASVMVMPAVLGWREVYSGGSEVSAVEEDGVGEVERRSVGW